jgi:hypothetical protein
VADPVTASPLARTGGIAVAVARARYSLRSVLSTRPGIYLPLARRRYAGNVGKVVEPGTTQVVIDGFQRSANTFAVTAFDLAQPEPVNVAHHLHAAAQIIAGVRAGIPTIVLARPPEETLLSHMIRLPYSTARQAIKNYIRFYEGVLPHSEGFVVGEFRVVTADFGSVIRDLNARFATSFAVFEHTEEDVRRCFELIEERNRERFGSVEEHTVARPSSERANEKEGVRARFLDPRLASLRRRADRAYEALVAASPSAGQ